MTVIDTSSGAVTKLPTAWKANIKTVTAIAYTVDGRYVVAAGASGEGDKNYMLAWDVKADRRQDLCIPAVQNARVSCIAGLSKEPSEFCAVGEATVGFYKIDGANFYSRVANFEEFDPNTVFSNVGYTERGTAVIGAQNGAIYAFIGASCKRVFAKVLPGPIESLLVPMTMDGTQLVITGGYAFALSDVWNNLWAVVAVDLLHRCSHSCVFVVLVCVRFASWGLPCAQSQPSGRVQCQDGTCAPIRIS